MRADLDPLAGAFLVLRAVRTAVIEVFVHRVAKPDGAAVQRELVDLIYYYLTVR